MPTVVLARHGRSTANTGGVLAGRTPGIHLDDVGVEQARSAGARLASVPLAVAVTSPLERCRETTTHLLQGRRVDVRRDKRLTECDYGDWSGQTLKGLSKEKLWRTVQAHPSGAAFPGGETMAEMASRAVAAIREWDARLAAEHGDDAVWLAVTHGDLIKAILADALGLHLDNFQRILVDPGSLSVVRYTEHRPFVVASNTVAGDLGHLVPPPRKRSRRRASSDAPVGGGMGAAGGATEGGS